MSLFNVYNKLKHKYTDERVRDTLSPWYPAANNEPEISSISSRLIKKDSSTNFIMYRSYALTKFMPFPRHYYVTIDDNIWHPGFNDDKNIFNDPDDIHEQSNISSIVEMCHYCTYWMLYNKFQEDKHFHIFANNCQIITGYFAETLILAMVMISLSMTLITGHYIFLLIIVLCILLMYINVKLQLQIKVFSISTCNHIIPFNDEQRQFLNKNKE